MSDIWCCQCLKTVIDWKTFYMWCFLLPCSLPRLLSFLWRSLCSWRRLWSYWSRCHALDEGCEDRHLSSDTNFVGGTCLECYHCMQMTISIEFESRGAHGTIFDLLQLALAGIVSRICRPWGVPELRDTRSTRVMRWLLDYPRHAPACARRHSSQA